MRPRQAPFPRGSTAQAERGAPGPVWEALAPLPDTTPGGNNPRRRIYRNKKNSSSAAGQRAAGLSTITPFMHPVYLYWASSFTKTVSLQAGVITTILPRLMISVHTRGDKHHFNPAQSLYILWVTTTILTWLNLCIYWE